MPEPIIDPNAPAVLPTEEVVIPAKVETPIPAVEPPVVPEVVTPEPFKSFETEEEYNTWVEEERVKLQPAPVAPVAPIEESTLFDPKWKPKDWNDFAVQLLNNPKAAKILQEMIIPETRKAIADMTEKDRQELEQINVGYDKEYNSLAKKGLLPSLDSEEGQKINQQISLIGATYGQVNLTKSYELWRKIPKSEGGGLEYTPPAKEKLNAQKIAAGKVASPQGGQPKIIGKGKSYSEIHLKSIDDQIEEAMR